MYHTTSFQEHLKVRFGNGSKLCFPDVIQIENAKVLCDRGCRLCI